MRPQSVLFAGVALDHEDLRYPRSERHGFSPRTGDALRQALLSRRDDGSLGFAYARTVSDLGTTMPFHGALGAWRYGSLPCGA